jgi:phage terminase large subunit GpA-like protein
METHPTAIEALNEATRRRFQRHCRPMPRLGIADWATRHRVLSPEATAQHGPWRNDVVPYLVDIMNAIGDRTTQEVVLVTPSQAGKSEAILNAIGFFIHQEPSPMLVVQPTVETGESFSKDRVAPMLRDSPALQPLVAPARSRDSNNTILSKQYPGGQLDITGANAPSGLAMRPKRVVLLDERDRHPRSAGTEGDVKAIARARTRSFGRRRKIVEVSSPTSAEESLIWPSYLEGTQEVWEVPCPSCGAYQVLQFERLKWELTPARAVDADTVRYSCAHCPALLPPTAKAGMLRGGRWTATAEPRVPHKRTFHLTGMAAAFTQWDELAQEFVTANKQDDPSLRAEMLRAFFNTGLGALYVDQSAETQQHELMTRAKPYDAAQRWQIPAEAGFITAGVDVQHDRLEIVVRAWGAGEESWLVQRVVLRGDAFNAKLWGALDEWRTSRQYRHQSGAILPIRSLCIDAGDGAMAQNVYKYCHAKHSAGVFAVKGHGLAAAPMLPNKATRVKPGRLYVVGVHAIMERIYRRLAMPNPGPGYLHLNEYASATPPDDVPGDYCEQLTSMQRVKDEKTRRYRFVATKGRRNEMADAEVYAYAALLLAPIDRAQLGAEVEKVNAAGRRLAQQQPEPKEPAPPVERTDRSEPAVSAPTWVAPVGRPPAQTAWWNTTGRGGWRR